MPQTQRPRIAELALFGRNFLRHPKMLGSVIPSSRFLVQRLLKVVPWERTNVAVEFGPGVGTITAQALRRLPPNGTLVAIDTNPDFVRFLSRSLPDPRLKVVHASAAEVSDVLQRLGLGPADCIISGIPYSTMPAAARSATIEASYAALRHGGLMLVYQFTRAVRPELMAVFGDVKEGFEPLNLLPARIFVCNRNGHHGRPHPDR